MESEATSRRRPIQERARETRDLIVRTYVEAALEASRADIPLDTTRRRAAVSTATTYRYFRNLEDLQLHVLQLLFDRIEVAIDRGLARLSASIGDSTNATAFASIADELSETIEERRGELIIASACIAGSAPAHDLLERVSDRAAEKIARAVSPEKFPSEAAIENARLAIRIYLLWQFRYGPTVPDRKIPVRGVRSAGSVALNDAASGYLDHRRVVELLDRFLA